MNILLVSIWASEEHLVGLEVGGAKLELIFVLCLLSELVPFLF